jgi:hypothetical protein
MLMRIAVAVAVLFAAVAVQSIPVCAAAQTADRQETVRERGGDVMPFALADTLHVFEKTVGGGVQRVEARAGHADQIPMIRQHLKTIAEQFNARDFSGPAHIHGDNMPGLAELEAAPKADLTVAYRDIDGGAEVTYSAATGALRDALHRWFDAQLNDHGHDAAGHHHHGS